MIPNVCTLAWSFVCHVKRAIGRHPTQNHAVGSHRRFRSRDGVKPESMLDTGHNCMPVMRQASVWTKLKVSTGFEFFPGTAVTMCASHCHVYQEDISQWHTCNSTYATNKSSTRTVHHPIPHVERCHRHIIADPGLQMWALHC